MFTKPFFAVLLLLSVLLSFEHPSQIAVANAFPSEVNGRMNEHRRIKRLSCTSDKCFKNCSTEPGSQKECASICECNFSSASIKAKQNE
ncbi:hypothetical protein niasHS_014873 [Heterodera schachtii]|uniref:Uncharacterized protein n=1 Tax=Heterodera schachtii TaxID=97005 RepID=A0ABD2INN9_HETSC